LNYQYPLLLNQNHFHIVHSLHYVSLRTSRVSLSAACADIPSIPVKNKHSKSQAAANRLLKRSKLVQANKHCIRKGNFQSILYLDLCFPCLLKRVVRVYVPFYEQLESEVPLHH
jgi:hypothetical protein